MPPSPAPSTAPSTAGGSAPSSGRRKSSAREAQALKLQALQAALEEMEEKLARANVAVGSHASEVAQLEVRAKSAKSLHDEAVNWCTNGTNDQM